MKTRGDGKTAGASGDSAPEGSDTRAQELSTREYELCEMERSIKDKENRLRIQENGLRQQLEELDYARQNLEREREVFTKDATIRENEITARERDLERKWIENSDVTPFDGVPREASGGNHIIYEAIQPPVAVRAPPTGDGGGETPGRQKVSFREATESVPYFDGYNIPLQQFTRACRRAREIVPLSAERNLTKLLINKLGRRAYYAVEDEPCDSVTELVDLLTGAFGSPKTLDQYRGELSIIYMKLNEHVLDYISRVKDIRTSILDAERRDKGRLDAQFMDEIDCLTARSFYQGLPLEFRLQIGEGIRSRYSDAFAAAKLIAKRQELDKQRYEPRFRSEREPRSVAPVGKPLAHSTPQRADYPPYRDTRYPSSSSPRRETPPRTYATRDNAYPGSPNARSDENRIKICRYCKNRGHDIEECRKRQYNNARRDDQGNTRSPTGERDAPPAGDKQRARPIHAIAVEENNSDPESQY